MEEVSFQALLNHEYKKESKIVQVLSRHSHDRRRMMLSDRAAFMEAFVRTTANNVNEEEDQEEWTPGSLIKLVDWRVVVRSSLPSATTMAASQDAMVWLEILGSVSLIGAQSMGIVGDPIDIHQTTDVRRAVEYLKNISPPPTVCRNSSTSIPTQPTLGNMEHCLIKAREKSNGHGTMLEQIMAQAEEDRKNEERSLKWAPPILGNALELLQDGETMDQIFMPHNSSHQFHMETNKTPEILRHPLALIQKDQADAAQQTVLGDLTVLLKDPAMVQALVETAASPTRGAIAKGVTMMSIRKNHNFHVEETKKQHHVPLRHCNSRSNSPASPRQSDDTSHKTSAKTINGTIFASLTIQQLDRIVENDGTAFVQDDWSMRRAIPMGQRQPETDITPLRTNATFKMPSTTLFQNVTSPKRLRELEDDDNDDDAPRGISSMLFDSQSSDDDDDDDDNDGDRKPASIGDRRSIQIQEENVKTFGISSFQHTRNFFKALLDPSNNPVKKSGSTLLVPPEKRHQSLKCMLDQTVTTE